VIFLVGLRIEDYALIGNTCTGALVGNNGSVDWLCMPRFDSGACFAALLGEPEHGRWLIAPSGRVTSVRRRYRDATLVLETEFVTETGAVSLTDFMPISERGNQVDLVRVVTGIRGTVPMRMEAAFRFDYGHIVPWVRSRDYGLSAIAGPDAIKLATAVRLRGEDMKTVSEFTVAEGRTIPFMLTWYPSNESEPKGKHPLRMLEDTAAWWRNWSARATVGGPWRELALRSLITLKALTYGPTGGLVAAPTASLPERIGGPRNWDYRYCWLRDATFSLYALLISGYTDEARAWREWLLRAVAGSPDKLQIMYGLAGERRLSEWEVPWLPGYERSAPVRIGNAAHRQFQLDVYGEIMDSFHLARRSALDDPEDAWRVQQVLMDFLESAWERPDDGIWEVRGKRRHFTHSKVMAWVAADRAVKAIERYQFDGSVERFRRLRDRIHAEVCAEGFSRERNAFVQYYGATELDASLLMIPLVGFLPPDDSRMVATVDAIRHELMIDGLVARYRTEGNTDGVKGGEGVFLACSFWLADNLAMTGRRREARELFERLAALCNDVGLLSEEYDPVGRRLVGNYPQAFTHVSLVNTVHNLTLAQGPAHHRSVC
jgi:GH15 family glucan-1,4-alpha-glucosidase